MKILVACEESQIVTRAFRDRGHEAYSCDILPTSGMHKKWHIQDDVSEYLNNSWDMLIAFPPCTDLAVSGARYFEQKRLDGRQQKAIDFFMQFFSTNTPKVCVENPVGIMSTVFRKPDQIIQPWYFGHPESKQTCLWLVNLPLLIPTNILERRKVWDNQTPSGQNKLGPSVDRAKIRSKTYAGIAEAMAEQWSERITV